MTVSELVVLTSHASNVCKSLIDHFLALSEEGKKEYKAYGYVRKCIEIVP